MWTSGHADQTEQHSTCDGEGNGDAEQQPHQQQEQLGEFLRHEARQPEDEVAEERGGHAQDAQRPEAGCEAARPEAARALDRRKGSIDRERDRGAPVSQRAERLSEKVADGEAAEAEGGLDDRLMIWEPPTAWR